MGEWFRLNIEIKSFSHTGAPRRTHSLMQQVVTECLLRAHVVLAVKESMTLSIRTRNVKNQLVGTVFSSPR